MTDHPGTGERPVLYVIACGSRSSADLAPFVSDLQADGWEVCVIATPSALKFMDTAKLAELTGHVVRYDYKQPDEPDVLPPADAMVVAPATFNTICKCAFVDDLSALKDGDSLHAARGTRGVRMDYRFAARCHHRWWSYLRSTVV